MTSVWGQATPQRLSKGDARSLRRALGAGDRRHWTSLARHDAIQAVIASLGDPHLHGGVIFGPRGVGKTTLARSVANELAATTHIVRLFGTGAAMEVPYSLFSVQLARLSERQSENPAAVLGALVQRISRDANGRPIVVILDDLPGIDSLSMGVLMHLVLGGKAKLLVVARSVADLPEDLVWLVKDGLLAHQRLGLFSRSEVRTLLVKALGGPVAESVVASLHATSAGNPLVLQALVHEHVNRGELRTYDGVWVSVGRLDSHSDDVLLELVETRLARETGQVRESIAKFSLLRKVPLSLAIQVLGSEALTALEERGYLAFDSSRRKMVTFAEPYIGETVRNKLSPAEKAGFFQELSDVLTLDSAKLSQQELLMFASWINEAGMAMEPEVAVVAAQAALQFFDPQLALTCAAHVGADHPLQMQATQLKSRAYYIMASYKRAAEVLERLDPGVLASTDAREFASWALELCSALLWQPNGRPRIDQVLDLTRQRVQDAPAKERWEAEKFYNLARFQVQVNRGEFVEVMPELEIASKDNTDRSYRLNCASMLTLVLAATGRELAAVELSQAIDAEAAQHDLVLRMNDWHLYGHILGLMWGGRWRECETMLQNILQHSNIDLHYRGGATELALGVVYAFAGREMQAAEMLLSAAAQLEVRNTYTSLALVYSTLAFVFSRLDDAAQSRRYLVLAGEAGPQVVWVNRTLADYFQALARHSLGDGDAVAQLVKTAERDYQQGKVAPGAMGLLAATRSGAKDQYSLLEVAAQGCQGALAGAALQLARAAGRGQVQLALDAAEGAKALEMPEVERQANELAMELATAANDTRLLRSAKHRLFGLEPAAGQNVAHGMMPLTPRELQVARQAIRGMSNRGIASKIGVSVRTVEGHLYQVFAKLGITSRTELEKWVNL